MMLACLFLIAFIPFTINTTESSFAKATADRHPSETPTVENVSATPTEAVQVAQPSSAQAAENKQSTFITINNNIKPDMLTYKHWTGKYNPDSFKVLVNKTEVAQGATVEIPSETKTVDLTFDYSFVNGKRTGSKTVSYKLNDDITQANITFSWDHDNKIIIDNGTAVAS